MCNYAHCGAKFARKYDCERHRRIHSEKMYACDWPGCGKKLCDPYNLERHMMVHKGELPFKCPIQSCVRGFRELRYLRDHIVNTHKFLPDTTELRIACMNSTKMYSIIGYNGMDSSGSEMEDGGYAEDGMGEINESDLNYLEMLSQQQKPDKSPPKVTKRPTILGKALSSAASASSNSSGLPQHKQITTLIIKSEAEDTDPEEKNVAQANRLKQKHVLVERSTLKNNGQADDSQQHQPTVAQAQQQQQAVYKAGAKRTLDGHSKPEESQEQHPGSPTKDQDSDVVMVLSCSNGSGGRSQSTGPRSTRTSTRSAAAAAAAAAHSTNVTISVSSAPSDVIVVPAAAATAAGATSPSKKLRTSRK